MRPLEYWRTDRNGTKYYLDWNCPRCAGAGESDNWYRTGKTCYGCGGTGKRVKPLIVKEYTPEHQAELDARRNAREAKREAEKPKYSEEEARALAEAARRGCWQAEGFGPDGIGYLHTGDTWKNRDSFHGVGRWNNYLHGYVAPTKIELRGIDIREIHAQELCNTTGWIDPEKAWGFTK